jgi:FkbM family methyltransferase
LIKKSGYELKGIKKQVRYNDFDAIINFLLKDKKKHVYFDVGANEGQSIERFKKINPQSNIHSFEPHPGLCKKLVQNFSTDKSIKINNLGVADIKNELYFNIYKYNQISSFVPVDKNSKFSKSRILSSKSNEEEFKSTVKIDITNIDSYCEENNISEIDFIKIDTQGYESKILLGMEKMLSKEKVSIIELELILGFAYEKSFSFYDYEKILNNKNYKLIAINHSGNIISFSDYTIDVIYVKNEIFENIRNLHEKNIDIPGVTKKTDKSNPFSY